MRKIADAAEGLFRMPDGIMGPSKPVVASEIDWFDSILAEDFDSAFTLSIRCCDACFDGFNADSPGTTVRNMKFQRGAVPADPAVTQLPLPDLYTLAEISTFRYFIRYLGYGDFARA